MNILLTSAGRRSYLVKYFIDALKGEGVVHASNISWTPALQIANNAVLTPLIYDNSYIEFLLEYSCKNSINVIIPLFDIDLPILAKAKTRFAENGINVVVSDYEVTQICNDKWLTYKFLVKNNIKTPRTFLQIQEVQDAIISNKISFPVIVKPRFGMGSIGIYTAENELEVRVFYEKVKRDILNTYLNYESKLGFHNSVIIQERMDGEEYGLDVINDLGSNYITTLVKKKLAMRSGETDSAITEQNQKLCDTGELLSLDLKHISNLDVDCFLVNDEPFVLEMNCRFGGGYPFSHLAGANLPSAIIKWINNEPVESGLFEIKDGITSIKDITPIILEEL